MSTSNDNFDADLAPPAALTHRAVTTSTSGTTAPASDPNVIPELTTYAAVDTDARIDALHLLADSVAQQRNFASRTLIYSPITAAILVLSFSALYARLYHGDIWDFLPIMMTMTGITMAVLGAIRWACGAYIDEAERVGTFKWLSSGRNNDDTTTKVLGEMDEILLTKFGRDIIGTVIFRGVQNTTAPGSPNKKSKRVSGSAAQGVPKTVIRAWTVRQKYRHKGVGTALLEDAVRVAGEKGWLAGGIEFTPDHAHHLRALPAFFNGKIDKNEASARNVLAERLIEFEEASKSSSKRRR